MIKNNLVLDTPAGIGGLGMGFENAGYCVVNGPDILWGKDMIGWHPIKGVFEGVIGGPPCNDHCRYRKINRVIGNKEYGDLIPEWSRIVLEADPDWALMENVELAPGPVLPGYVIHEYRLNARWLGLPQNRDRRFFFASKHEVTLIFDVPVFESIIWEPCCMASEGKSGRLTTDSEDKSHYHKRRDWEKFLELQGFPHDFLKDSPFTVAGKYMLVGNAVALPVAEAIAKSIREALNGKETKTK